MLTRDWAVKQRAFVFDLSPWGDEKPGDDPGQRLGLDLETYNLILAETLRQSAGKHMTELTGFFAFSKYSNTPDHKSAHEGVPTEWETVWLMSPFNCYQNTISSDCFNQSLHSQAPRRPLKQRSAAKPVALENKAYICILMADYDSATPLYDFLPEPLAQRGPRQDSAGVGHQSESARNLSRPHRLLLRNRLGGGHVHRRCQRRGLHEPQPHPQRISALVRAA